MSYGEEVLDVFSYISNSEENLFSSDPVTSGTDLISISTWTNPEIELLDSGYLMTLLGATYVDTLDFSRGLYTFKGSWNNATIESENGILEIIGKGSYSNSVAFDGNAPTAQNLSWTNSFTQLNFEGDDGSDWGFKGNVVAKNVFKVTATGGSFTQSESTKITEIYNTDLNGNKITLKGNVSYSWSEKGVNDDPSVTKQSLPKGMFTTMDLFVGGFSVTKIKVAFTLEDLESLEISNIYDFLPEFLQGADKITVSASDTPAVIFAYGGNDTVDASKVTDDVLLFGGGDTDVESGSDIDTGNDILKGGAGDDALFGQDGNDTLTGGLGNDSLLGGLGKDKLTGGLGDDLFIFDIQELDANASDSITDFKMVLGNSDSIEIYDSLDEEFIGRYLWANTISEIVGTADDIIYESKTGKLYYNDGLDFTLICGMVKGITEQAFYNYFEPA